MKDSLWAPLPGFVLVLFLELVSRCFMWFHVLSWFDDFDHGLMICVLRSWFSDCRFG